MENIYRLNGRVPIAKAIPFGLQHVLAMFVANLSPMTIIATAAQPALSQQEVAMLIQNAMFAAGIATMIQLYPLWKIGSKLPIVMGVSFTFVTILSTIGANYGYPTVIGAVLVGGCFEGILGLLAKYWKKIVSPIVAATVVTSIGFSLFTVGARSFGGGYAEDFGSAENLAIASLIVCILWSIFVKGYMKQLSVLAGLIVGYVCAIVVGKVDYTQIFSKGLISLPHILPVMPKFNIGAILSTCIIFLVSATETIGDTTAMVVTGLNREITEKEISGSLACDGFASSISALFGCCPVTSFSQNVGLIAMTKVVNRFTIATGAMMMLLAGLLPPVGQFFASLPQCVLGGCTIMMFGTIVVSGMQMIASCGFSQRNIVIASLSLAIGIGFTYPTEVDIWKIFPEMVRNVFGANVVAVVFVVAIILNLILPKNMDIQKLSVE